ncbi:anhydro-N-acetylmuramic acid kinase [Aliiglaciecola litoralis]|uniref:Anhydro-N-acetylmuramic acid kinase n=1 Tax=Aliiglaciecola litoralis TaxID=582857 RepID=A0ABN1LSL4_9ALTE
MSNLYIGLMSGTSMDGVDVAIVDFSKIQPKVIAFHTLTYTAELLQKLNQLCAANDDEIVDMGQADRAVAMHFADAVKQILQQTGLQPAQIAAIGSHGQTIRHHPNGQHGFTLQIGDPNTLAVMTGIDVIADFRRKDIALGGQGAPLAPAFHQAVFRHSKHSRIILNIGGISNITYIPKSIEQDVIGFDTGPGNTLMDAWCKRHLGEPYDHNGHWAASGNRDSRLLQQLMVEPFFAQSFPKSTGRETFNLDWLDNHIATLAQSPSAESVQATLAMLTTCTIASQINVFDDVEEVFVCGGGANNDFLMECLENELVEVDLATTNELGISPDAVEAVAFAWLAYAHINHIPGNLPSVTGAAKAAILGGFYHRN